jgi:hypothetical protein
LEINKLEEIRFELPDDLYDSYTEPQSGDLPLVIAAYKHFVTDYYSYYNNSNFADTLKLSKQAKNQAIWTD